MASLGGSKISPAVQPKPEDYDYDLDRALASVVTLHSIVPADAFTAETLGTERGGNAVLIRDSVALTIGYLIMEAESIWLTTNEGKVIPGHVLAYDQETGFGLVQALGRLDLPSWPGLADASTRWRRASSPSRSLPEIGNMCSRRRSSPRRYIPIGVARP